MRDTLFTLFALGGDLSTDEIAAFNDGVVGAPKLKPDDEIEGARGADPNNDLVVEDGVLAPVGEVVDPNEKENPPVDGAVEIEDGAGTGKPKALGCFGVGLLLALLSLFSFTPLSFPPEYKN